ncbi:hypothetical protein AJ88_27745 [Mesorhizobium amorphae CCBAU 01583]|nr:hypothetical protein AJ88_27745 [Mesorhizobium amorphae CCBAU 01583]
MPKGMDPQIWRQSVEKRLNDLLDRAMSLITALDLMEADCDLEDTADDEPSLGWTERGGNGSASYSAPNFPAGDTLDLEQDNCDDEDGGDEHEPSLGWSAGMNQEAALADTRADVTFYDCEPNGDEGDFSNCEDDNF